jgi:hypothetical protein
LLIFPSAHPLHILQEGRRDVANEVKKYNIARGELDQARAGLVVKARALDDACTRLDALARVEVRKSALLFDVPR